MNILFNKKAITPIISVVLLLLVVVTSFVFFSNSFSKFQSKFQTQITPINSIKIEAIKNSDLIVRNFNSFNVSFNNIKIDKKICNLNEIFKTLEKQFSKIGIDFEREFS